MKSIGIAIICKTPEPGKSKTRLSPPMTLSESAELSSCFIADLAENIQSLCNSKGGTGYALYTPIGSAAKLQPLLPAEFKLLAQSEGDLGARLNDGISAILSQGHHAAIIINSDSPTLPMDILGVAIDKLRESECVALGPSFDGGYTFIGLTRAHERLFEDMPWSTDAVHRLTEQRASEIAVPVFNAPMWYDVDDAESLDWLMADLTGRLLPFAAVPGTRAPAPRTQTFLKNWQAGKLETKRLP